MHFFDLCFLLVLLPFFLLHPPFLVCRSTDNNQSNNFEHSSAFTIPKALCPTLQQAHFYRCTPLNLTHATHSRQQRSRKRKLPQPISSKANVPKESHCCCQCCLFSVPWSRHRSSSPSSLWLLSPSLSSPQSQNNATIW
ncbi:hypothetical protein BKA57DRAFT_476536 [Linnemannia elongata]|nr:hypothetical protein BKA57DRAFT_476536 [Linnemannia elongata]